MTQHRGIFTSDAVRAFLEAEPTMTTERLSERLWTTSDGKYRTVFVEADSTVVAFDTLGTPARARAYRAEIARVIPGKPVGTVIYTHDHLDHAGYAADFAPDATIVADEMTAKVVAMRGADGQPPATEILSGAAHQVDFDGARFRLLNPGPTHGTGHLSAYFADEKVFFSSDTVLPNARYGLMPDYHLTNFATYMRGFLELDFETFVPGRYEVTDRARFAEGIDYIEAMQVACQEAFVNMVPIWVHDAMMGYVMDKLGQRFGHLDGFAGHCGQTAVRIVHHYLMGGWGLEDTPEPGILLADVADENT
jgi:glyoxylase-like metal-dependent hydrolase (beta-lactamase superfamily II)